MLKLHTLLFTFLALTSLAVADWTTDYARLLGTYTTPAGVKYGAWKANPTDLQGIRGVVEAIAAGPAPAGQGSDALAFYVNAYNAWILHEALEKYPVKSVKDPLFTFFIGNRITVAGRKMSFNTLEKDLIRARFREPRIHFALNCASRSCPPLLGEPYSAARLDAQLESQARVFINSERGVRTTSGGAQLSTIFKWYDEDFGAAGGTLAFINQRRQPPLPPKSKISYQEYDWSLNEVK